MNLWDQLTGADLDRDWRALAVRAQALPEGHQQAWQEVFATLVPHAGSSGRTLTPLLDSALTLVEVAAAEGRSATEVFGGDVHGFALALLGGPGTHDVRQRWRRRLNDDVARKLGKLGTSSGRGA